MAESHEQMNVWPSIYYAHTHNWNSNTIIIEQGFFLELYFRGGNCFCGERKCEKHPAGRLKLLVFGGEI